MTKYESPINMKQYSSKELMIYLLLELERVADALEKLNREGLAVQQ